MKRKDKRIGIRGKLFAFFAIFVGLTLILLWTLQVVFLDDFYKAIKTNLVKRTADTIAANIEKEDDLQSLVTQMSQNFEVCISVYDMSNNGTYLADSDVLVGCFIHKMMSFDRYRMCQEALLNGGETLELIDSKPFNGNNFRKNDPDSSNSLLYIRVIQTQNGHNIAIMINGTIVPVTSTVQTLKQQMILITGILLLIAAGFAILLSKLIAKPIAKLNDSAKALATGHYETSFHANGYREIEELSHSLDYASKELRKTDEYRRELLANVTHDLRTPLTLITGYGEVMRDIPGENNPENLTIIISEAKRLTDLVNDMVDQTKYEDGAMRLELSHFNLSSCLNDIAERYRAFTKQEGYHIFTDIEENMMVYADQIKITQAIYNLLNNAINYTGTDKHIYITLKKYEDLVYVAIRDTGDGIDEKQIPHIWNRYYKSDKEHQRFLHGSGLGLSIVKNIFELHELKYGVQSKVGLGSTFWFALPEENTDCQDGK